jgi:hypothetical protein
MAGAIKVDIKPLSVNECYQGRRFKNTKYHKYDKSLTALLPDYDIPSGKLKVYYEFGLSNMASDWDNPIKNLQDILQRRYGFNDRDIYEALVIKTKVAKGEEFIKFKIESL